MNRRGFLAGAAVTAFPNIAAPTVRRANERVHVGIIGTGGRAQWLIRHEDFGDARITAVADVWPQRLAEAARAHSDGGKWASTKTIGRCSRRKSSMRCSWKPPRTRER